MLKRFNTSIIPRQMRPFTFNDQLPSAKAQRLVRFVLVWSNGVATWSQHLTRSHGRIACPTRRWTRGVQASELWDEESPPRKILVDLHPHLFWPNLITVSPQNPLFGSFWCLDNSSTQWSKGHSSTTKHILRRGPTRTTFMETCQTGAFSHWPGLPMQSLQDHQAQPSQQRIAVGGSAATSWILLRTAHWRLRAKSNIRRSRCSHKSLSGLSI